MFLAEGEGMSNGFNKFHIAFNETIMKFLK